MNMNGKCEIENMILEITTKVRPFLNIIKVKGIKSVMFLIDDFWLYSYHKI